jgi:AbrB family looped-hinge helix DNA binding protein
VQDALREGRRHSLRSLSRGRTTCAVAPVLLFIVSQPTWIVLISPPLPTEENIVTITSYELAIDKEFVMETVTISPKFQVVIPKRIREGLDLRPGQKVQAIQYADRVELVPVKSARQLRGFLRGIDTRVPREADRL